MFSHSVFFTLKDWAAVDELLGACRSHLTGYPGTVSFACGPRALTSVRNVDDQTFDLAVHLMFDSQVSYDAYAAADRHTAFSAGYMHLWSRVRVFDAIVGPVETVVS
jgi:hypothetical protein